METANSSGVEVFRDVLTIREAVQRAKNEGMPVSEYTLRHWVKIGAVPVRKIGQKALLFYPNLVRYLQCEDGTMSAPVVMAQKPGVRRIEV